MTGLLALVLAALLSVGATSAGSEETGPPPEPDARIHIIDIG